MGYLLTLPMPLTEAVPFQESVLQLISHLWHQVGLQVFVFYLNLTDDLNQFITSRSCQMANLGIGFVQFSLVYLVQFTLVCFSLVQFSSLLILVYLLTAIGLSPGGSSAVHIYTQTIHRTTQTIHRTTQQSWKSVGRAPSW